MEANRYWFPTRYGMINLIDCFFYIEVSEAVAVIEAIVVAIVVVMAAYCQGEFDENLFVASQ